MTVDVLDKWQQIFTSGRQLTQFPFSELVSLFYRFKSRLPSHPKVLELGCGPGANIPLFLAEGADFHGIEGSSAAVEIARKRFPAAKVECYDFRKPLPFGDSFFDLVVDRSAITHNKDDAPAIFSEVHRVLKPSGLMIGIDYFSKEHRFYGDGAQANQHEGSLFLDRSELTRLLEPFRILLLQECSKKSLLVDTPENTDAVTFDFVVEK